MRWSSGAHTLVRFHPVSGAAQTRVGLRCTSVSFSERDTQIALSRDWTR